MALIVVVKGSSSSNSSSNSSSSSGSRIVARTVAVRKVNIIVFAVDALVVSSPETNQK